MTIFAAAAFATPLAVTMRCYYIRAYYAVICHVFHADIFADIIFAYAASCR